MRFTQFVDESIATQQGVFVIKEGIDHIEALPLPQFINAIRTLTNFRVTEKLDGANLIFGFESDGKLYTSREAKGGAERMYNVSDYTTSSANTGFAAAHAALEEVKPQLKKIMKSGEACEVEVLFGRQPNAIVYGSNYIAFLRILPGDNGKMPDQLKAGKLHTELDGTSVTTSSPHVTTEDGIHLETKDVKQKWKFASTSTIDSKHFESIDVENELHALEVYLQQPNSAGELGLTNGEITTINLTSVKKPQRPEVKQARSDTIAHINDHFRLPIKEKILNKVLRALKPALRDVEVGSHEDLGVEGVVLLNPDTLQQMKIVDKDVFTIINQFNFAIRNQIKFTGGGKSSFNATLGRETDIFGVMLKHVADALGLPALERYGNIKRALRKFKGDTPEATLTNVAKEVTTNNVGRIKTRVNAALEEGLHDLEDGRKKFLKDWQTYSLKLKTGKEVKYTDEIRDRTLLVFAGVRTEMDEMRHRIQSADTIGDVLVALYGRQLKSI